MTNVDIDSGTIDGITIGTNDPCTELVVDDVNINGKVVTMNGSIIRYSYIYRW